MLQNIYSLPDLIDLALTVPEAGAVNFNILRTVLHAIVKELKFTDIRPWCQIENPLLVRAALTKAKLQGDERKRTLSDSSLAPTTDIIFQEHILPKAISADNVPTEKSEVSDVSEPEAKSIEERDAKSIEKPGAKSVEEPLAKSTEEPGAKSTEEPRAKSIEEPDTSKKDSVIQTEIKETKSEEFQPSVLEEISALKERVVADESKKVAFTPPTTPAPMETDAKPETMQVSPKSAREGAAESAWKFTNLNMRVDATEEGLHRLSNIVDLIVDKMKKGEQRKTEGGFQSEELESFDERMLDMEDTLDQVKADHSLLLDVNESVKNLLDEFETFKDLASQLEQMQSEIEKKADEEEILAALALKGDMKMIETKIDRLEFETAIDELGEAVGELGLKFTRKVEEWDKRAEEIWDGINSKMTRDVFEEAKIKTESRITALLYGTKRLKKVVEELLYPEASGVTKCIVCRRPACISGSECIGISYSPKRPLSEKYSEEDDDSKRVRKMLDDAFAKRKKLDVPPYCESRDTIIKIPYSSSSYRSSAKESQFTGSSQMKLMPVISDRDTVNAKKPSQVPKLPDIKGYSSPKVSKRKTSISKKSKSKPRTQRENLKFTKKLLADYKGISEGVTADTKWHSLITTLLEEKKVKKEESQHSFISSRSSVVVTPDPDRVMEYFAPAKVMPDALRRDVFVSRASSKEQKMTLSPLEFDEKSKPSSSKSSQLEDDEVTSIADSPEISDSVKEDEGTTISDNAEISEAEKEDETNAITDSPEASEPGKEDEEAAITESSEISEPENEEDVIAVTDSPEVSELEKEDEEIEITDSPDTLERGKENEMTEITDSPEISEPEKEDEVVQISDRPEISEPEKEDEAVQITDLSEISEPEKEDEVVQITNRPKISEPEKEDEANEITDRSDISEPEMETSEDA